MMYIIPNQNDYALLAELYASNEKEYKCLFISMEGFKFLPAINADKFFIHDVKMKDDLVSIIKTAEENNDESYYVSTSLIESEIMQIIAETVKLCEKPQYPLGCMPPEFNLSEIFKMPMGGLPSMNTKPIVQKGKEPIDEQRKQPPVGRRKTDAIRPEHYGGDENPFEPIKIIQHYKFEFALGNAIKYILRAGKKDKSKYAEDLKKAIQYIKFEIKAYTGENMLPDNEEILSEAISLWEDEYKQCRDLLVNLVNLKDYKEHIGEDEQYRRTKTLAWKAAKDFLRNYTHG